MTIGDFVTIKINKELAQIIWERETVCGTIYTVRRKDLSKVDLYLCEIEEPKTIKEE